MSIASSAPTLGTCPPSSLPQGQPQYPPSDGLPDVPYNSSSDPGYTTGLEPSTDYFPDCQIHQSEIDHLKELNSRRHRELTEIVKAKLLNFSCESIDAAEEGLRRRAQEPIELSPEQQQVHHMIVNEGKSMFFTGAAGTGKSILLRRVIEDLRRIHGPQAVAVTAPTGIAAVTIGGRTLHAWSGIGLGTGDEKTLLKTIRRSKAKIGNWAACKVIVIDEISMLSPELFDKLNAIAKKLKSNQYKNEDGPKAKTKRSYTGPDKSKLPFGGIQLVVCGDFYQLPPVDKNRSIGQQRKFAFDATAWKECIQHTILLTQVFRQKDQRFQDMLNEVRFGKMTPETIAEFKRMKRDPQMPEGVVPTKLFALRHEVDTANKRELDRLPGNERKYIARDEAFVTRVGEYVIPAPDLTKIQWTALQEVRLKEGAQVMMIKNIDETLVNGSVGKIIKFIPKPPSLNDDGRACVALSDMITSVNGMLCDELERMDRKLDRASAKVATASANDDLVPLVRFYNRDGTVREVVVCPEEWVQENEQGEVMARRVQIPLILAYALSIHKSQGQTLDYVSVNMHKAFEAGQTYVALSRATSLEGLQIIGFDDRKVLCDNRVSKFYAGLTQITRSYQPSVADMFRKREPIPEPEGNVAGMFDQFIYKRAKPEPEDDLFVKDENVETLPDQPMPGAWPAVKAEPTEPAEPAEPAYPVIDDMSSDIELPEQLTGGKPKSAIKREPDFEPMEVVPAPAPKPKPEYDSDYDSAEVVMVRSTGRGKNYYTIY